MKLVFDPAKDVANLSKHGVSLVAASRIRWDRTFAVLDTRFDYGEGRQIGYGPIGLRIYCVIFVDRRDVRRIISLRKANRREVNRYEEQMGPPDEG